MVVSDVYIRGNDRGAANEDWSSNDSNDRKGGR
jgi:hypothetical protein